MSAMADARIDAIEQSLKDQDEVHAIVLNDMKELKAEVRCVVTEIRKYRPLLEELLREQKDYAKLRAAVLEKSIVGIVWAAILLVAVSLWFFVKQQLVK